MRSSRLAVVIVTVVAAGAAARFVDARLVDALPVAINLALAAAFAWTLRPGSTPMVSRFARRERGELEPELVGYTRRLTIVWVGFFVAMAGIAAALSLAGWRTAWLVFSLAGNYALVAALIVGEYLYRRRRYAHLRHAPPAEMWRHARAELRRERSR
jgi:uncharacterized membrane protein